MQNVAGYVCTAQLVLLTVTVLQYAICCWLCLYCSAGAVNCDCVRVCSLYCSAGAVSCDCYIMQFVAGCVCTTELVLLAVTVLQYAVCTTELVLLALTVVE
jgi:hypothetical protein